jgi:hypothetical protein
VGGVPGCNMFNSHKRFHFLQAVDIVEGVALGLKPRLLARRCRVITWFIVSPCQGQPLWPGAASRCLPCYNAGHPFFACNLQ